MKHSSFLIAFLTTIIRYYDYALFGLSAAILSKNFLPVASDDIQLLVFFSLFSTSVSARPIGSIIFGFISDKYGRTVSIKISVILATISTIILSITPNYINIGVYATIILLFCRMIFIMSLAGEIDSIRIYVAEKAGIGHRNVANGIISFCSQLGALLAATVYHFSMSSGYADYSWRWTFIFGGVMSVLIIVMRRYFQESEEFLYYKSRPLKTNYLTPWQIIRNNSGKLITAILISGCCGGVYHFLIIFFGTFLVKMVLIISPIEAQIMNIILISIYAVMSVLAGFCADKINAKKQIIFSLILSLLTICVMQYLLQISLIWGAIILITLTPFYVVPLQIILQSIFATNIKTRMYSFSHSLGSMLFSSTTPFFCMLLWQYFHSLAIVLGFFMMLIMIICGAVWYLFKSKYIYLEEV